MWKNYSLEYIRKNRASSLSVAGAAFFSALFLSLLCSLFFNVWTYEIQKICREEGDWQGRITGVLDENDLELIRNFSNVERVEVNTEFSEDRTVTADIWFCSLRTIYQDMDLITKKLGLSRDCASFHELLLSRYLIHDPGDREPPLLMAFFLVLLLTVSLSLVLIIHNAFAVTMESRVHQLGILSSIGATPGQILGCLMQEAAVLCALPGLSGILLGILMSFGAVAGTNVIASEVAGRQEAVFQYHPLVFGVTAAASVLTIALSAWIPARRLSRMTPLESIRNSGGLKLKKKNRPSLLPLFFGIEGELAANALKAQKKALAVSSLSLTLSSLGFMVMMCFFTLSRISTEHTYFERYQDAWDVMATVEETRLEDLEPIDRLRNLNGVRSCIAYEKASALCIIPEEAISREVKEAGGPESLAGDQVSARKGGYLISAPLVILDDAGFEEYCGQIGVKPQTSGTIVLNRIWDSGRSNFRYKKYLPFTEESLSSITVQNASEPDKTVEIPVLAFTDIPPVLREEYDNYALVQFLPLSLWKEAGETIAPGQTDVFIRLLASQEATAMSLGRLEDDLSRTLGQGRQIHTENRIKEKTDNQVMEKGMMLFLGAFCCLLAAIGIANVFSNTLGFLRQRKREFARYMSIGMTPSGMKKMFCIEAAVIGGRPLLLALPLTAGAAAFMVMASYLEPAEFLAEAPVIPILAFSLGIFGFVALAYRAGWKRLMSCSLTEALRNDCAAD